MKKLRKKKIKISTRTFHNKTFKRDMNTSLVNE